MSKGMWDLKKLMFLVQGGLCFYCWKPMSQEKEHGKNANYATKDHLLPISHGGSEDWTNTVLACLACNRLKANRPPTEAERARHGHYLALFNERVELRRTEIEAKEKLRPASLPTTPIARDEPAAPPAKPQAEPVDLEENAPDDIPHTLSDIGLNAADGIAPNQDPTLRRIYPDSAI